MADAPKTPPVNAKELDVLDEDDEFEEFEDEEYAPEDLKQDVQQWEDDWDDDDAANDDFAAKLRAELMAMK